ncbi:MAG: ABC transporter permease [Defluviitaleaceae bacterium]|nr:ABC transporter permease [Defluviitaleaceae bacterium]
MNKIFMLAKGNIRKAKGQMIILAVLFLIAATLLIMGLSVIFGFNTHFDELVEELNATGVAFNMSQHLFTPGMEEVFRQNTTDFEIQRGVNLFDSELTWNDEIIQSGAIIYSMGDSRRLSQWKLVGEYLPLVHDSVYIPYMYHYSAGYNLGDVITVIAGGQNLYFTVTGFIENIWADTMSATPRFFITPDHFEEIYASLPHRQGVFVYANGIANTQNFLNLLVVESGLGDVTFDPDLFLGFVTLDQVISGRTGTAFMMSIIMIAFTAVIGVVSILVIHFRIKNSIEEDMPNIGSLMSIGYTSRQVMASVVAQYASIIFISVVVGIVPAVVLLPFVGRVFAVLSGMYWQPGFMPVPVVITVVGLTALVLIFTRVSARGIKKIAPVIALRGGVKTHCFKRNPLPLEKSIFSVNTSLALKSVLQGFKQSAMMFTILLAVSFTAVVALIIFYNASIDLAAFEQVPGIERSNADIVFTEDQDNLPFQEIVNAHQDVRDSQFFHRGPTTVSGEFALFMAMEDFARRATQNIFDGIFPRYENEVAITWLLAQELGVGVGDLVYMGNDDLPFLVTGLASGMELGQFGAYITYEGVRVLMPHFQRARLTVYLNPGVDALLFNQEMESLFGDYIFMTVNIDDQFARGVAGFADIMSLVGVIILVVSTFVIILVLYFVIGSTIVRKHRDLGIHKAVGYTTANLMNQISLAFSFPILLGTAAGVVLGVILVNPLMAMGMRPMGVMQANLIISGVWAGAAGGVIVVLAYVISMLVTWRIRKISAYRLVTE